MAQVNFDGVKITSEFSSEVGTLASGETLPSSLGKIAGHISNGGNPHNVTASQVGAYTKSETDSAIAGKLDATDSELQRVEAAVVGGEKAGVTWTALQAKTDNVICRLQVDASTQQPYLFVSTDGGSTWSSALATSTVQGFMSASDKSKLDEINTANLITTSNISSQSVSYATSAGNADTVDGVHIACEDTASAQGSWFCAFANSTNIVGIAPSRAQVGYAASAGNASAVGGVSYTESAGTSAIHKMSAGSSAATTSNCPAGAWYGQW